MNAERVRRAHLLLADWLAEQAARHPELIHGADVRYERGATMSSGRPAEWHVSATSSSAGADAYVAYGLEYGSDPLEVAVSAIEQWRRSLAEREGWR